MIQTSVTLTSGRTPSITNDGPLEFECRSIYFDVEEGQQARTDGVLSSNGQLPKYRCARLTPQYRQASALTPQATLQGSSITSPVASPKPGTRRLLGVCLFTPKVRTRGCFLFAQNGPIPTHSRIRVSDAKLYVIVPFLRKQPDHVTFE